MAEKHDQMLAHYRARLVRRGYKIRGRSPFVDYRPDIYATKRTLSLFVEAEIESTLHSHHTLEQLEIMHTYVFNKGQRRGVLLVPRKVANEARFLIDSVFGDKSIHVECRSRTGAFEAAPPLTPFFPFFILGTIYKATLKSRYSQPAETGPS